MRYEKICRTICIPFLCLLTLLAKNGYGQEITTSGRVVGEDNVPVAGVSVVVGETTKGTVTDENGNYTLRGVSANSTLVFSFLGMKTRAIAVDSRTLLNVTLIRDATQLDEVVTIGYGTAKKSDLTGAISSVKGRDLRAYAAPSVLSALEGRSAGVQVLQNSGAPGAAISIRIRGANSIQGSNEPLYVIDGFPSSSNNPDLLSNYDIASIEVLKDASAIAIYGSRGANGVVLITTNHGAAGKTRVSYEGSYGSQTIRKTLKMMDAAEYAGFYNEQRANDGLAPIFTPDQIKAFGQGFDWQKFTFHAAPIQNHSVTVSGGNEKTLFSLSGSFIDQDGIIPNSYYKRYSFRSNISHNISDKFSLNSSVILSKIENSAKGSVGGNQGQSLISSILCATPTLTPYNDDGTIRDLSATSYTSISLANVLYFINEEKNITRDNRVLANVSLSYKITDGLTLKVLGGIENTDSRNDDYRTLQYSPTSTGYASVTSAQYVSLLNENTLNYEKTFNKKHHLSAIVGWTYQDFTNTSMNASGTQFLSDVPETYGLSGAGVPGIPSSVYTKSVLLSYLGRINYIYDNRYFLTFSFRGDGSSKYSAGNKWGYFPAAAIAWAVKNEKFMHNLDFLSNLKLRASLGATGSQAIDAYATLNQLYSGHTVFGNALTTTYAPGTNLPGNLKWETTEQSDFGLDAGFFNNRIQFSADYYIKNTRNLLNSVQLPPSQGYLSTLQNVGQVRNQGLELSVDGRVLENAFKWELVGNITFNRSKVIKLYGGQDILGGLIAKTILQDNVSLLREGQPMSVFYGYVEDGYNANGNIKYKDLNGDGLINQNDKAVIGNPNPKFYYGLNSFMSFHDFSLSLFFQGSQGNDIVNVSSIENTVDYGYGNNLLKEVYDNHWTPANTNAKYPKATAKQAFNFSNRYVENGSYLRLKNVELAYSFRHLHTNWIRSAQLYISGQNLLTITGYSGWDPEVNSNGGPNSIAQGLDNYTFPTSKTTTIGVRLGF